MNNQVNSRFKIILDVFASKQSMELDEVKAREEAEAVERMKHHNKKTLEKIRSVDLNEPRYDGG